MPFYEYLLTFCDVLTTYALEVVLNQSGTYLFQHIISLSANSSTFYAKKRTQPQFSDSDDDYTDTFHTTARE